MSLPLQIGVTGGIGSGKSIVCRVFSSLGVPVYDSDSRAKTLMTTDGILTEQIKKEFGNLSYNRDGTLNRDHLSGLTFHEPERLQALNKLVHPRVGIDYNRWIAAQDFPYAVKEAALLFETGSYRSLDKIIVVTASEELRVRRVVARDRQRTEQQVRDIMKNQMADTAMKADFVIINDESQLLIPQVLELHKRFMSQN